MSSLRKLTSKLVHDAYSTTTGMSFTTQALKESLPRKYASSEAFSDIENGIRTLNLLLRRITDIHRDPDLADLRVVELRQLVASEMDLLALFLPAPILEQTPETEKGIPVRVNIPYFRNTLFTCLEYLRPDQSEATAVISVARKSSRFAEIVITPDTPEKSSLRRRKLQRELDKMTEEAGWTIHRSRPDGALHLVLPIVRQRLRKVQ